MRYLVDGYNVALRDSATAGLSAEEQRDVLVRRLAVRGPALLGAGRITVIFDGQEAMGSTGTSVSSKVEVAFSRGESADDLIARIAGREPRGSVTVVTADGGLAGRVREFGAKVIPPEAVFESAEAKKRQRRREVGGGGLPKGANRITEELRRIWLDQEE